MMRFLSFGSGSSGNSYLLECSTDSILIDAGVGYRKMKKYMKAYGVNCSRIKAIILTHDHTDHISAVSSMAIYLRVPVYATDIVHQRVKSNFRIHVKIPREQVYTLQKRVPFQIGGFTIEAFDVLHDSADCSGYTIEADGKRFVLVTDCGRITDEITARATQADYLVLESNYDNDLLENGPYPYHLRQRIAGAMGHLSNTEAAKFLATHDFPSLKELFLCHLSENNNTHELVHDAVKEAISERNIPFHILERRGVTGYFDLD